MLNRLFYLVLFASLMALLTMPARGADAVADPPPLADTTVYVGGQRITYAAAFGVAPIPDPPRLCAEDVTRGIRAADAALRPPVTGVRVLPDEVRKCPAGKCAGEGCRCADESKCGTASGTCKAPLLPPLPAMQYDADHVCNKCGSYQNVISRFLPGGAHSHRCNRCGNEWYHGSSLTFSGTTTVTTPVAAPQPMPVAWPSVGGCSSGNCSAPQRRGILFRR